MHYRCGLTALLAVFFLSIFLQVKANANDFVFNGKPKRLDDFGYFVPGTEWPTRVIYVCWENPSSRNQAARSWVQEHITATWQRHTGLTFKGWQACDEENLGIRIIFRDEGPHVRAFGSGLDGLRNGMVLNHTYRNWGQEYCATRQEECTRVIAVHEFGHAIGFAHEQNQPSAPGECLARYPRDFEGQQSLTPYDKDSVMNYCNRRYNNDGELSKLDIAAAQVFYGKPDR